MIIAITGLGAISALGRGADALFEGLCAGRSGLEGAPVWGERGPAGMLEGGRDRRSSTLALEACREALGPLPPPRDLAVVGATTSADMRAAEPAWRALAQGGQPSEPETYVWPQLCHLPTQHVARQLGARGPRLSLSTACTSGACAVGVAADMLRLGRAPAALAFGVDALCDTTVHGFASLGLYDPQPCRPFHPERKGLNLGEGAGALLLEPLEAALARGAQPIAILAGYGNTSDAHRLTAPEPGGARAGAAIRMALGDLPAERVGWVCAHATGTSINDQTEAEVLSRELPSAAVAGIKGAVGHTLGAAGALEAVVTAMAVQQGRLPPHAGELDELPPGLALLRDEQRRPLEAAVSVNFAFGGHNTALLVTRWTP
jgi:3-oxoacyl-[acyl-carrier-protein] synthase II